MMKLNPGATVRISRDDATDLIGACGWFRPNRSHHPARPCQDNAQQQSVAQGRHVRPRQHRRQASCGVAVPRTAIDHLTVQVVKGNTVETRKVRVGLVSGHLDGNS